MDYEFIGWCNEDNHDKVWVLIILPQGRVAAIWGRRGRTLQHKIHENLRYFEIDRLVDRKVKKGYQRIEKTALDQVYPEFEEDLQKTYVWAVLQG